jgi:hypothetical protein
LIRIVAAEWSSIERRIAPVEAGIKASFSASPLVCPGAILDTAPEGESLISRVTRYVLVFSALLLVSLAGFFFVREVARANPPTLGHFSSRSTSSTSGLCSAVQTPLPRLTFVASRLDTQTNSLHLAVFICMSQVAEQHLEYAVRRDRAFQYLAPKPIPEEPFTGLPSRLKFGVEYQAPQEGETDYSQRHEFPLWNIYALEAGYGRKLGEFDLPLGGSQASYPLDRYSGRAELQLPLYEDERSSAQAFYCANGPIVCVHEFKTSLPTTSAFVRGTGIAPYEISATVKNGRFRLVLARPLSTQGFVLAVALIPLLLACVLALVLSSRDSRGDGSAAESVTGVAAVLLAILPIRLVLVPGDVSELTLVDYLLGFEMATLAAIAALAVSRDLRSASRARDHAGHAIN